jgi:hypothetical protein
MRPPKDVVSDQCSGFSTDRCLAGACLAQPCATCDPVPRSTRSVHRKHLDCTMGTPIRPTKSAARAAVVVGDAAASAVRMRQLQDKTQHALCTCANNPASQLCWLRCNKHDISSTCRDPHNSKRPPQHSHTLHKTTQPQPGNMATCDMAATAAATSCTYVGLPSKVLPPAHLQRLSQHSHCNHSVCSAECNCCSPELNKGRDTP